METPTANSARSVFQAIPVDQIKPSRHQARRDFDEQGIKDLAESMKQEGLLQPITVRQIQDGFELIGGERRLRAAKLLGWTSIDAKVIRTVSEGEAAAKGLIENLQRRDLNPIEEAYGFQELNQLDPGFWTHERIALNTGKSRPYITESLSLLGLPEPIKANVCRQTLSRSVGIELARLRNQKAQLKAARQIEGLNRAEARKMLRILKGKIHQDGQDLPGAGEAKKEATLGFQFKMEGQELVVKGRMAFGQGDDAFEKALSLFKEDLVAWATGQPLMVPAQDGNGDKDKDKDRDRDRDRDGDREGLGLISAEPEAGKVAEEYENARVPKSRQEQTELENLIPQGPAAAYGWIYGKESLVVKRVEGLSWENIGIDDPKANLADIIQALKDIR